MAKEEKDDELPLEDGLPRWPRIFQKKLTNVNEFTKICTLPSDTHHWKMSLMGVNGTPPPDGFIQIAYEPTPEGDAWFPLYTGTEASWRHNLPKHIYGKPFHVSDPSYNIVVIEAWCTKMPSEYKDKEKSKLGKLGSRQR